MKKVLTIFIAIIALTAAASAKTTENISLHIGGQKTAANGKVTVKFVSVIEDSRCPANAKCVWAGNAKIKISVKSGRRAAKMFELNSTLSPKSITFDGYKIAFVELNPIPGIDKRPRLMRPVATISVTKLITRVAAVR